jgi:hypothetical protein
MSILIQTKGRTGRGKGAADARYWGNFLYDEENDKKHVRGL